jgi:hypothetical protein
MNNRRNDVVGAAFLAALTLAGLTGSTPRRGHAQVRGDITIESRVFPSSGLYHGQDRLAGSVRLNPRYDRVWSRGRQLFSVELFGRLDLQDAKRTHFDVRQLSWLLAGESWELRLGIRRVFWGVTESQHLVDVINQTDLVEDPDGEDRLGQPMVNVALIRPWGTLDLFVLPGFRKRSFAGREGRLRPGLPVVTDLTTWESGAGSRHIDLAARWSHSSGAWDLGVSHFHGTGREPRLRPTRNAHGVAVLAPHYEQIDQTGIDAQITTGAWLGKLEGVVRQDAETRFAAATVGFEYTMGAAFGTSADLGLLAEYLWDERGDAATTPFEDDIFLGARLAFNDVQSSELLAGAIIDRDGGGSVLTLEASRRLKQAWSLSIRALAFTGTGSDSPLYGMRRDDFIEIGIARHF